MTKLPRTWSRKGRCLRAFAKTGSAAAAARAAGVHRATVYAWKATDADFAERWAWARQRALDALQDALVDRARNGGARPIPRNGPTMGRSALRRALSERRWRDFAAAHFRP
ncbi:MAG: hypothetical protein PSV46_15610 [Reyranella sp.]|nr:hypothetical protein [Reyranella sp.]